MKTCRFCKKTYRARILIESARFPPFSFDTVEISFNLSEIMPVMGGRGSATTEKVFSMGERGSPWPGGPGFGGICDGLGRL